MNQILDTNYGIMITRNSDTSLNICHNIERYKRYVNIGKLPFMHKT